MLVAFGIALTTLLALAAPASAHAQLVSTDPVAGAALPSSPAFAQVLFDDVVDARRDALQLHDSAGRRVDDGDLRRIQGGKGLRLELPHLNDGGYVLTWRVVSDDGHPVSGGVTWRVGAGKAVDQSVLQQLLNAEGGDANLHAVAALVRTILFGSLVLLVGGLLFVLFVWPAGADERRTRTTLRLAAVVGAAATVLSLGIQGADIAGFGLSRALSVSRARDTLDGAFGRAAVVRFVLLLVLGWWAATMTRERRRSLGWGAAVGVVSALTLATLTFSGHARTGRWTSLAVPLDVVHMFAAAVWIGGLAMLIILVLPRRGPDDARIVERFSSVAAVCVGTVAVTGLIQAWRQLRHVSALRDTEYGRLLIIKVVIVGVVVAVGAMSRSLVRARRRALVPAGGTDGDALAIDEDELHHRLRLSVGLEVLLGIAVLVTTSLLVAANPTTSLATKQFSAAKVVQGTVISAEAVPARPGPITFHLFASDPSAGLRTDFEERATLSLPERGITGVNVPFQPTGRGHWTAEAVEVPVRGRWRLDVTITIGGSTTRVAVFDFDVS